MKNSAIPAEASEGVARDDDPVAAAWAAVLRRFDADLRRRSAAEKTRRAYASDLGQFAAWAGACGLEPTGVDMRDLRRYAASLSARGLQPATVARKLAALRGLFRSLVEHGDLEANPADLLGAPKRGERLPRTLKATEVAALLDRIPARGPLELRDRAMFELAYAAGLRAEEIVLLDVESVRHDAEEIRVEGKGGKTRFVPAGEPALAALRRYLATARPPLAGPGPGRALFVSKTGRRLSTSDVRRRLKVWGRHARLPA